jgi:hypothetical protein
MSKFLKAAMTTSGSAFTKNSALSYASSGDDFIDQFAKAGTYVGRDQLDVNADMELLWGQNPEQTLKFMFYLRLITRKPNVKGELLEETQRGQGLRDEFFKRMNWLAVNKPDVFIKNVSLIPYFGRWKDIFDMLRLAHEGYAFPKDALYSVIIAGLEQADRDLVLKYLPKEEGRVAMRTKYSRKSINTDIARGLQKLLGLSSREYRVAKSDGKAHIWQKRISQGQFTKINWSQVSSKARHNLIKSKFVENHKLNDQIMKWLDEQPVVKFVGYPHELAMAATKSGAVVANLSLVQKSMLNKQFDYLLSQVDKTSKLVWVALDVSASMTWTTLIGGALPIHVAASLSVYFASLNTGTFANHIVRFDSTSKLFKIAGDFVEKYKTAIDGGGMGSTNFQSVIDLLVRTRRENPSIPLEDYPEYLLIVSDMQFNPVGGNNQTNYEAMITKISAAFPKEYVDKLKMVYWQVNGKYASDMPATLEKGGQYFFSGFDPSIIQLLLGYKAPEGVEKDAPSMIELFDTAMGQKILQLLSV